MVKSKRFSNAIVVGLFVLFAAAGAWAETKDVLPNWDRTRAIWERQSRGRKPGEQREAESSPVNDVRPKAVSRSQGDELLAMVPAESLFCVRVNNFDYTINQIDQFLIGVSPMPLGLSMMARMQFAEVLGSAELIGVNMGGSFAIFGVILPGASTETNPASNVFIGALVPVTDYKEFISGNPNCGQPNEKGISKITSKPMPAMLVTPVGSYALISSADNYDKLITMAKSISDVSSAGLTSTLDAAEAQLAMTEPVWAYGNVQQAAKAFGPVVFGQLEQAKTMMENMQLGEQGPMASPANIMNMYAAILETLMDETRSLSLTVSPKPNACNMTVSVSAVPGTDMADMLVADASADQENNLLGYLEDGAMVNFGCRMSTPSIRKFNVKRFDLLTAITGESISAEDVAKMKRLAEDWMNTLGGPAVFSFSIDAKSKPPFAFKYIMAVKDERQFNRLIEEGVEMMNTGGIADLYKSLGMEMSFAIRRGVDSYKGFSIDSGKLVMKSAEPDSPQALAMNAMFGEGFDYRWSIVDGLFVCAVGGDVDLAMRKLIDQTKTAGPKQMAPEMRAALALIPTANKADFVGTYNFLRLFKIVGALTPIPMPQMDIPTKSNIAFAGKAGNGKLTFEIALPKEHLTEIMTAFQKMQQQKATIQEQPTAEQPMMQQDLPKDMLPVTPREEAGPVDVKVGGVRLVRYSDYERGIIPLGQNKGYTLSLIAELAVPVVKISDGRVEKAITDTGKNLLPQYQWDRRIKVPRLAQDKQTVVFDVELLLPDRDTGSLEEVSGTLECLTASGSRELDLGIMDFEVGAKGKELGAVISSIEADPWQNNPTTLKLRLNLRPEEVNSVEFYAEDDTPLDIYRRGYAYINRTTTLEFSIKSKLPPKGRVVLNVFEELKKNIFPFKVTNISLTGQLL